MGVAKGELATQLRCMRATRKFIHACPPAPTPGGAWQVPKMDFFSASDAFVE